jgi:two-component system, NarL family, sensor histidine kinase UhpB
MGNETPAAPPIRDQSPGAAAPGNNLDNRIGDLEALVTFLQADNERKSNLIARKLHDELGGSVIGAMMDVAWIELHDPKVGPDTAMRLGRVKDGLRGAIDLTRKIVEELRPTLLDSMGLFAALSWQFKRSCAHAGIAYTETYPDSAPQMDPNTLIELFRIAQESFNVALQHEAVSAVDLSVATTDDTLTMQLTDDGRAPPSDNSRVAASVPMSSILHRVRHLKGETVMASPTDKGSLLRVTVPLS